MDFSELYLFEKAIKVIMSIELNFFIIPELFNAAHKLKVRVYLWI